jgi:hypothetical protein
MRFGIDAGSISAEYHPYLSWEEQHLKVKGIRRRNARARDNGDFLKDLRAEITESQRRRGGLVKLKVTAVISIFGLDSIKPKSVSESLILCLVPFAVFVFDLYIIGENFGIRRAGSFILNSSQAPYEERRWESFARTNRDRASTIANSVSSLIFLAVSAYYLWHVLAPQRSVYWIWLAISAVLVFGSWTYERLILERIYKTGSPHRNDAKPKAKSSEFAP